MASVGELRYLPDAQAALATERRRLESEARAFRTFLDRLESLTPASSETVEAIPATQTAPLVRSSPRTSGVDRVREAYRETVMSVPHYEADYGEPLDTNLAAELGTEIAEAVTASQPLNPMLKRSLVGSAREARTSRTALLAELDREARALDRADATFVRLADSVPAVPVTPSTCSFERLADAWRDLAAQEREYARLCRERQAQLGANRRLAATDGSDLCRYLYGDLDVTHPVLADALERCRHLRRRRRCVLSLLVWAR